MQRRWGVCLLAAVILFFASRHAPADEAAANGVDRAAKVHALLNRAPTSREEWEARENQVRQWLVERLGDTSPFAPAAPRKMRELTQDGYVVETLEWDNSQGHSLWCVLVPTSHVGRGPAVISFPADGVSSGKNPRFRSQDGKESLPADAARLAKAGYVVLAAPAGGTLRHDMAACQYLLSRRDVDPERLAVWGSESGARRAWRVAVLEERVAAVVSLGGDDGDLETRALLSLIAPRPHWFWSRAPRVEPPANKAPSSLDFAAQLYAAYDLPALFRAVSGNRSDAPAALGVAEQALKWLRDEL